MDRDDSYLFFEMPGAKRISVKKEFGDAFFGLLYKIPRIRLKRIESASPTSSYRGGLIWLNRSQRTIEFPKSVGSPYKMAVIAHEVAHCVLDHHHIDCEDNPKLYWQEEAAAWKWAYQWLHEQDIEITKAVARDYRETIEKLIGVADQPQIDRILPDEVWVRKTWDGKQKARVKIVDLKKLHWSATEKGQNFEPQSFLHAHIARDSLLEGELPAGESSRSTPEIPVCIVRKDNDPGVYTYLKARAEGRL